MGRKSSGLRNKYRTGRSTYSVKRKSANKDHYGSYTGGVLRSAENIAGHSISAQLRGGQPREREDA